MNPGQLRPAYPANNLLPPSPSDEAATVALQEFLDAEDPLESDMEQRVRADVLIRMRTLLQAWAREVCVSKGVPEEEVDEAVLFISGSYFLGVNTKGADLDTIAVVPELIEREDFFSEDPALGLVGRFRSNMEVTQILPVPGARVPIISIMWGGIDIDVMLARLNRRPLPRTADALLDDTLLFRADEPTVFSLNGPRVNNIINKLVLHNRDTFVLVLRALRLWAKRKGIYSNKLGFLGGVNFAILSCFITQLFPRGTASKLLLNLMRVVVDWRWPLPLRIVQPYEPPNSPLQNWQVGATTRERMPIITPAYPNTNSSFNVTTATQAIMLREFEKSADVISKLLERNEKGTPCTLKDWAVVFAPQPFFLRFKVYVALTLRAGSVHELKIWNGFSESKIRKFVELLERLPLYEVFPCQRAQDLVEGGEVLGQRYFIGLRVDEFKANTNVSMAASHTVNLEGAIRPFLQLLMSFEERVETMTAEVVVWKFKDLLRAFPELIEMGDMTPQQVLEQHFALQKEAYKEMEFRYSTNPVREAASAEEAVEELAAEIKKEEGVDDTSTTAATTTVTTAPAVKRIRKDVVDITSIRDMSATFLARKMATVHEKPFEQQARPTPLKVVLDR